MQRQQFNRSSGVNEGDLRGDRVGGWRQNLLAGIGSPVNLQNDAGHLRHRGQPVQAPQAYNYNRPDLVQNQPFHNEYASKNYKAQQERLGLELRQVELEIRQTELHRQILQSQEMVEHGNGPFLQSMVSHLPVPSHSSEKIAPNGHTFPSNFGSGGLQVIATDHSYDKLQRQEDVARWMPSNLESPTSVKYNRGSSIAVRHDHIDPGQNLFRTASYRHFQYGTEKDLEHDAYDRSGPSRQEKTTRLQDFDDRGLVSQRGTESTYHASNHERKLTEQMHTQTAETLQTTVDPPIVFDAPANVLSTAAKTSSPTSTGSKWIVPYDVRKLPREPTLSSNPSVRQSPMFDQDSEEDDLALVHVTHDRINLPAESTSSQSDHRSLFRVLPGLERLFHQNGHRNTMPGPSHHKSEASFRANKTNFQPRHQESKARDFEDLESGQRERGNSLLTPANESTSVPSTATQRHKIHPLAVDPVLSILQPEPGPLHLYYDDARRHDSVQEEELRYKKPTVSDDNSRHDQLHTIQKPNDPAPQPQTRLVDENINNDQITTSLAVHSNQPSPIPPIELAKNNGGTLTGALHPQRSSKPTLIPVIEAAQQDVLLKAEQLTNVREPHRAIAESPSKNVDVIQVEEETCYCGAARPSEDECYFCWPCNGQVFCAGCWMMCPPHKKNSFPGRGMGLPHEKSDPATARKIYETLQSDQSADEQARLHKDDLDTSWFGTGRDEVTGEVVFQDFGRYPRLMQQSAGRYRRIRYPALVSFVGQTGAGKSSLIRLLIEIFTSAHAKPQVPVVGSTLLADLPTSGDVHLYSDPRTYDTEQPILFADCEGLNGGEREPMGARAKGKTKGSTDNHETTPSLTQILSPHHQTSEREISWADSPLRRSREYHVHHLYPRLLYTFSDVIVFVMKNPRVIENTIEQLVSWAAAALETSSNQPVLPHAVIVLNAYDNASDPNLWDVNESTVDLMERVSRAVHKNHNMRKFAEFWRERGKCIESVQMLLHSYYSSIRVVRVPERGRPKLINEQVTKLYDEIRDACESSLYSKHKLRMLLNADELQPYLQYAFDHFSRNLEHPFDFVQASLANNPMPSNFGGNILKLAIDIMDHWRDTLDGPSIFKELSFMVASCIMLDSARHRTLGPAERVLGAYVHFCNDALEVFCNRHWPCEYVHEDTQGRCVNVRAGHQSKGHQLSNGRVTGVGAYESDFTPEKYRDIFQYCVLRSLKDLLMRLGEDTKNDLRHELQKAGEIHCEKVLHHFYRHLHGATNFISHTACFCCLVAPPEHALPCGHVLCTPCVQAFGSARGQCYIEMSYCPLHKHDTDGSFPTGWLITVKPYGAGVRVACLDNGMIRTVAQLVLLQQLELHLGPGLPIQAFIDLFIREGSGGIIALALGVNGWSVEKTTRAYKDICARVFAKKRLLGIPGLEFLPISNHRRYDSKRLEAALMETFGNSQNLFAGSRDEICRHIVPQRRTKAAVIVTTALGKFELLGNYNRLEEEDDGDYHFRRSEKPKCEIKISQAARASFSMPQYFSPVTHDASGQVYQDASHYHSCPVEVAAREARLIWPDTARSGPDILLSIGTGIASGSSNLSRKPHRLGFSSREKQSSRAFMEALQTGQASEKRWNTFIDQKVPEGHQKSQYSAKMDDLASMDDFEGRVRAFWQANHQTLKEIADGLRTTSFYFVLNSESTDTINDSEHITIDGMIHCRFSPESPEIRSLGEALRKRIREAYRQGLRGQHDPYFVIREKDREDSQESRILTSTMVDKMILEGVFHPLKMSITLSSRMAESEILFCFGGQRAEQALFPISGGNTRCFVEETLRGKQRKLPMTTKTKSPQIANFDFEAISQKKSLWNFAAAEFLDAVDVLQYYSSSDYVNPGDANPSFLSRFSARFKNSCPPYPKKYDPFATTLHPAYSSQPEALDVPRFTSTDEKVSPALIGAYSSAAMMAPYEADSSPWVKPIVQHEVVEMPAYYSAEKLSISMNTKLPSLDGVIVESVTEERKPNLHPPSLKSRDSWKEELLQQNLKPRYSWETADEETPQQNDPSQFPEFKGFCPRYA